MMKIEFDDVTVAYALPPKADIRGRVWRVCQVPIADMAVMSAMCAQASASAQRAAELGQYDSQTRLLGSRLRSTSQAS